MAKKETSKERGMDLYSTDPEVIIATQHADPFFSYLTRMIFEEIPVTSVMKLLDLGCGTGRVAIEAARRGMHAVGIDSVKHVVDIAKKIAKRENAANTSFYHYDIREVPKSFHNKFDVCVLMEVIEHIDDYEKAVDCAFRCLKKGGYLFLTTPNQKSEWTLLDDYAGHVRRLSVSEVERALNKFSIVETKTIGFPLHRMFHIAYDKLLRWKNAPHKPRMFRANSVVSKAYYLFGTLVMEIDDLFPTTTLGTTIVAVAKK